MCSTFCEFRAYCSQNDARCLAVCQESLLNGSDEPVGSRLGCAVLCYAMLHSPANFSKQMVTVRVYLAIGQATTV